MIRRLNPYIDRRTSYNDECRMEKEYVIGQKGLDRSIKEKLDLLHSGPWKSLSRHEDWILVGL